MHVTEKLQLLHLDLREENSPVNADSLGIGKPGGGGEEDGKEEEQQGRSRRPHGLADAEWRGEAALSFYTDSIRGCSYITYQ